MIRPTPLLALLVLAPALQAQSLPAPLAHLAAADDAARDSLWAELQQTGQIPFVTSNSVTFLFLGDARSVVVIGDHTGWAVDDRNALSRLPGTNLWARTDTFPPEARIDYQLAVDGAAILDPANPDRQMSGFGPNSVVALPGWRPAPEASRQPGIAAGTITHHRIASGTLGTTLAYSVYRPAGFAATDALPVIYATDGHEYLQEDMGAAAITLDNLIASGAIVPTLAVFIDPRIDGENRRVELFTNPEFASFIADELVPAIDAAYSTRASGDGRVLLGTSFGGVFATFMGLTRPDVFARLAVQSPAFWVSERNPEWRGPRLATLAEEAPAGSLTVHLSAGTINDGAEDARTMVEHLRASGQAVTYREVAMGHSWGNWRHLLPEALRVLLPPANASAASGEHHDR